MSNEKRPDRTTKGMIWNANHVLDQALSPDTAGIPRGMIKNCKGIILLSVVEAGFIFSSNVGTGVIIGKSAFVCFVRLLSFDCLCKPHVLTYVAITSLHLQL